MSTEEVVEHLAVFYATIREPGPLTIRPDYSSAVVRRFFDVRSPVAEYVSIPRSYVVLQRINLGLFAVLGELSATARLAVHRRGDLAVRPGPAVDADRRGRGRLGGEPSPRARCSATLTPVRRGLPEQEN